jgi:hypothetical protein
MMFFVFDAAPTNFMPTEGATAQTEPSSMEINVSLELLTNASAFETPTGMELTVSASQDSQPTETHVIAMVLSLETSVKDAPPSQTLVGPMEFANVTMGMLTSMVFAQL